MEQKAIQIGALQYDCKIVGDLQNQVPIVLLHGWPATNDMWNSIMPQLNKVGFSCLAPPLRGFSSTACPKGKKHYGIMKVVGDVRAIIDQLGIDKFHLVGHDWGGWVGWILSQLLPDRIMSWTAISVPHMSAFSYAYQNDKEQYQMSFYMRQFRAPWLPEWVLGRKNLRTLRLIWQDLPTDLVELFVDKFSQKRILTASINYYRQNYKYIVNGQQEGLPSERVKVPTLFIWGEKDEAVSRTAAEKTASFVSGSYKLLKLDAKHWVPQEQEAQTVAAILEHIRTCEG